MNGNKGSGKDVWDKLDVIGKLASGLLLGLIAIFIKFGSDNIATSLHTGELVKSLINDLTVREEKVRQDIALIALNRSIGDQNPGLIAEIAETIIKTNKNIGDLKSQVAFKIMKERNPSRANEIDKEGKSVTEEFRKELRSDADVLHQVQKEAPIQAQRIASVFPNVVYIQFRDEGNRNMALELRKRLEAANYYAPGVERVDADFPNNIRFFHKEDEVIAAQVAKLATDLFRAKGYQLEFHLNDLASKFKVPRGQVEVWVNLSRP